MIKKLFIFTPIISFLVLVIFFAMSLTRDPARMPSQLIDRALPAFKLEAIQGYDRGLEIDDFKGKVSLLNVFGSWCVSCRVEHPFLMELAASNTIPIYGLNWKDKPGDGTAWLARHGDPYTLIGDDQDSRTAIDLGVTGAPETFVIDQAGRVRYKHVGPLTPEVWQQTLYPLIQQLRRG